MNVASTTTSNDTTNFSTRHLFPNGDRCNVCQRQGLPILPLRRAYYSHDLTVASTLQPSNFATGSVNQLRTLRSGYLYMLMDNGDWMAYAITPEGVLRQFSIFSPPQGPPSPLSPYCSTKDHDVIGAFLNIDTTLYKTAWIAFSNNVWPEKVLNRYKNTIQQGRKLKNRFYELDLETARTNPAQVGIAMTPYNLQVDTQVLEYATPSPANFLSVHGWCSRNNRLDALRNFVKLQMNRDFFAPGAQPYRLDNGILAIVLPDPIGLVQETNYQRCRRAEQMRRWQANPERSFKVFTSQALLQIKEVQNYFAEKKS